MTAHGEGWLQKRVNRTVGYAILFTVTVLLAAPIFFLIMSSLKLDQEIMAYPIKFFPDVFHWENYQSVFTLTPFVRVATRTGLLALGVAIINTAVSSLVGYGFARYRVPGNKQWFGVVIATMIVPYVVILIPQFLLYARLQLTNSYWPWILGALAGDAFHIFLFRQFFLGFPKELEEAAEVDGCGPFRIFWQIFLPNAKPAIATVMIFTFNGVWGDYLRPLIYLNENKTLLGVILTTGFRNPQGHVYQAISNAANVLYIIPLVIVFFLAQKHILKGVVTTGLKG